MEPPRLRCSVVLPAGPSRRVGAAGLWIGRGSDCELVTTDPAASRRHALLRLTTDGVELVPLGKGPTTRNGKAVERATLVHDGDAIGVPGLTATIQVEAEAPSPTAVGVMLARHKGGTFGIGHTPFVLGGAGTADLILKTWPVEPQLRIHLVDGEAFVELCAGAATLNDVVLELAALEPLAVGDRIASRDEVFTVEMPRSAATTAVGSLQMLPTRIEVEILPRGGRIAFWIGAVERRVYLADKRLDLLMALLKPPGAHRAGDYIPDDAVRSVVWPRNASVSRQEINTLIARCRRDLVDAGLAGPRLIERAPGGGGTRVALAANAEIVVKS